MGQLSAASKIKLSRRLCPTVPIMSAEAKLRIPLARRRRRATEEHVVALLDLADDLERAAGQCRVIAYQEPLDRVLRFLNEETERSTLFTSSAALFARYVAHCAESGTPSECSPITFGKKLQALGLRSRKSHGVKVWVGIHLKGAKAPVPAPLIDPGTMGMVRRDEGLLAASVAAVIAALAGMDRRNICTPSPMTAAHHPQSIDHPLTIPEN